MCVETVRVGKRTPGRCEALIFHPPGPSALPHVKCTLSGLLCLVDSGAAVSILPRDTPGRDISGPLPSLTAANGQQMHCYGLRQAAVSIGGAVHRHTFAIADTSTPILGWDFLHQHAAVLGPSVLKLSCRCSRSRDNGVLLRKRTAYAPVPKLSPPAAVNKIAAVRNILQEYSDIFSGTSSYSSVKPTHGVKHRIKLNTEQPVRCKPRRLDPERLSTAKRYFSELVEQGICRRAESPFASPLHMVRKSDNSWRPCGDYRALNSRTLKDSYTLPNLKDFTANLAGKRFFSTIDLVKGYYQVEMHPDDIQKTAVITPFGTFVFLRMPFGLMNAGSTFQKCMDAILGDLDYVFVYLDDILIASSTFQEHCDHLRNVLELLRQNGLSVNASKSVFCQQ